MTYKTVTIDVDFDLDEWDDEELIEELEHRGYSVIKGVTEDFDREDYDSLIEMIDKQPYSWYTRRIRDKLFTARHGD